MIDQKRRRVKADLRDLSEVSESEDNCIIHTFSVYQRKQGDKP